MITQIQTAQVFVSDYDTARAFYTEKLGFEVQMDAPMGPEARWVQLGLPGAQTSLVLAKPIEGMPGYELTRQLIGSWATFILGVDDMEATHQQLMSKGVHFQDEPSKQDWGWWASVKDPDGNVIGLHCG